MYVAVTAVVHACYVTDGGLAESLRWGPIPMDSSWSGSDALHKILMDSASYHAHLALRDFTKESTDMAVSAMHAGIAVEQLAKCYLCTINPVLIASRGCDLDTLLHLTGRSDLAKIPPHAIQTIGGHEACLRIKRLAPDFRFNESDKLLFTVRNSVSHIGITHGTRQVIRIMVRLADLLLVTIGVTRQWFWGNRLSIVDTLRDEAISEQLAILQVKYEAARRYLTASLADLTPTERSSFKVLAAARTRDTGVDYQESYTCPVCDSQGVLLCHREYDLVEEDPVEKSYRVFTDAVAYPSEFQCGVCNLKLDGSDMEAAGMPSEVELPQSEIGRRAPP